MHCCSIRLYAPISDCSARLVSPPAPSSPPPSALSRPHCTVGCRSLLLRVAVGVAVVAVAAYSLLRWLEEFMLRGGASTVAQGRDCLRPAADGRAGSHPSPCCCRGEGGMRCCPADGRHALLSLLLPWRRCCVATDGATVKTTPAAASAADAQGGLVALAVATVGTRGHNNRLLVSRRDSSAAPCLLLASPLRFTPTARAGGWRALPLSVSGGSR